MEQIQSQLLNLGYNKVSEQAFNDGPLNLLFVDIVAWLSSKIINFYELECHVSHISDLEDSLGFLVEVSSFLKELCCPYKALLRGQIAERLVDSDNKKLLITYLCTELEAAKILASKRPKKEAPLQIELEESKTAKELREMLICLGFPKPPETITPQMLFGEVERKLKTLSQPSTPKDKVGPLLFSGYLTEKQWFQLEDLYKEMFQEYKTRRSLLLTRADVTVKSFSWSDRLKAKSEDILRLFNKARNTIAPEPIVKISHILAAKADLAIIEKTSSASVRKNTKSSINSVVIGSVPDRGGRPEEQQPPPPEVPSWQKNDSSSRGGMRQSNQQPSGNYQQSGSYQQSGNYQQPGNYQSSASHRNPGFSRDENSNPRSPTENIYKGDISSRGNYQGGRNDYNAPPIYQPINYCAQLGNPQLGFGGYMPAGDNFQQFGMADGMNSYMARPRGSGPRPRGGAFSDRGSNQSRGRSRGRGRY